MSGIEIIPASDRAGWNRVLAGVQMYDFCHLPEYHLAAAARNEGEGILCVFRECGQTVAWPFLIRNVDVATALGGGHSSLRDATSVYGYCGPVCSAGTETSPDVLRAFADAFEEWVLGTQIVCLFSRLHPVLSNEKVAACVGTVRPLGNTVVIDLRVPREQQLARYRTGHRYEIRRARAQGLITFVDSAWAHAEDFRRLYHETMVRVGAEDYYFFEADYFERLRCCELSQCALVCAAYQGQVCSAALFMRTGSLIQYFLSGSSKEHQGLSPAKAVLDEACAWGRSVGAEWLHLGGGVGSREDGLFAFKAGFSSIVRRFGVWERIVDTAVYDELVRAREKCCGRPLRGNTDYFPLYRAAV